MALVFLGKRRFASGRVNDPMEDSSKRFW